MGGLGAQVGDPKVWARDFVLATVLGLFLAPVGPFGSYGEPFGRRLLMCLAFSWAAALVWSPGLRALLWLGGRGRVPEWLTRLAAVLVLCAPIALLVGLVGRLFWSHPSPRGPFFAYPQIASLAVPLTLLSYGVKLWLARRAAAPAPAAPSPPRLLARLPAAVEGQVLALQAEDHYVRVHTARGSTLLLMRMGDAIAELDGLAGLQVHRSWWVARAAVAGAAPAGRRAELVLTNGLVVPVSRAAMRSARAAGFLGVRVQPAG